MEKQHRTPNTRPDDSSPKVGGQGAGFSPKVALTPPAPLSQEQERGETTETDDFLTANPFLIVDTKHFAEDFKWKLLAEIEDLDGGMDGLLINSENFQALGLLQSRYREAVKCIYIDPPYNTAASKILYKNDYEHSSWMTLIDNRLAAAKTFLRGDGVICITIDDFELHNLWHDVVLQFGSDNLVGTAVIRNNPQGRATVNGFAVNHEYALFFAKNRSAIGVGRLERSDQQTARYGEVDEQGLAFQWENFRKTGTDSQRNDRPKQYYPIYFNGNQVRVPSMKWEGQKKVWKILEEPQLDEKVLLPNDESGVQRVWKWGHDRVSENQTHIQVREVRAGEYQVFRQNYLNHLGSLPGTWWDKPKYAAGSHGTNLLTDMFGSGHIFSFPKSLYAVEDCLRVAGADVNEVVMDFFGGSGTTGHATINLNRADGEDRKYVLVEMGSYFDHILVPRIKKAIYRPNWKNGKPAGGEGISQMVKYHTLEQYEDSLNNLELLREKDGSQALDLFGDEYLLRYMLDFETQGSQSLLNVNELTTPFEYKLKIKQGDTTPERTVDLVETFNYLLGLTVRQMRPFDDNGRLYRTVLGEKEGKRVVVVWRNSGDLAGDEKALAQDRKFITGTIVPALLLEGTMPDSLYVNSPSSIEGAKAIEPEFHKLMFAGVG